MNGESIAKVSADQHADILQSWLKQGVLITDGAWGTQLQARGLAVGDTPDTWNLSHPDEVESVARGYVDAGSQVILTNTFRANSVAMHNCSAVELDAINRAGVALSKRAAGDRALVFASIGPTGKILMTRNIDAETMRAAFAAQAVSLASAGADALLIETISDLAEARIAIEAARQVGLPLIVSFTFDSGKQKDRTMMGTTPEAVAVAMVEAKVDAVGFNCGIGIESAVAICQRLRAACNLPLWIKPNAGLPKVELGSVHYDTSAEQFAGHFSALRQAGANFVGACCGSTPDFIRALVAARGAAN